MSASTMSTSNSDFDAKAATDSTSGYDIEAVARLAQEVYRESIVGVAAEPVSSTPTGSAWGHDPVSPVQFTDDAALAALPNDLGPLLTLVDPTHTLNESSDLDSIDVSSVDDADSIQVVTSAAAPAESAATSTESLADVDGIVPSVQASPTDASIDELVELGRKIWDSAGAHGQSLATPPSNDSIQNSIENYPTSFDDVIELAAGDHPFLTGKAEGVLEAARDVLRDLQGQDASGVSVTGLEDSLSAVSHDFSFNDHLDTGLLSDTDYGVAGITVAPETDTVAEGDVVEDGVDAVKLDGTRSGATDASKLEIADPAPSDEAPETGYEPQVVPQLDIAPEGFDAERLRDDFPILSERVHGQRLVWLDNGATTQKPQCVIDRISYFYEHENSNVHRTAHTLAGRATDAYEGARDKIRRFLNARSADEIVFVRGATEGMNLLANTFGEQKVGEGDEILISWLEHHANIVPWQMLCQRKGAKLKVAPVDDSGQIILSEFERLITPRTKLISFTQVSNALGTITPAAEMIEIAHRHGVPVILDGAQGVLHMQVDVQQLDPDFYVFSGHKMFAPTGIGAVYGKKEHLDKMPPWQGGGNMIDCVQFDRTTYQDPPWRFEAGTGNIADAVGLGAAVDYVTKVGMHNIAAHEHELLLYGTEGLLQIPGLRLIGTATNKAAVMSFDLAGHKAEDVGAYLDQQGIAVRAGHHCAQPILRRFGVNATVRPSLALYNTHEDLDRLFKALHRLTGGGGA